VGAPIVYFDIAGPDASVLRSFFETVFDWQIDDKMNVDPVSTGGLAGHIREDPADKLLYMGVDDVDETLSVITNNGGEIVLPRTVVAGVVTFALFKDPAGNLLGIAEKGSW